MFCRLSAWLLEVVLITVIHILVYALYFVLFLFLVALAGLLAPAHYRMWTFPGSCR